MLFETTANSYIKVDFSEMSFPNLIYQTHFPTTPIQCKCAGILSSSNGFLHMKRKMEDTVLILMQKGCLHMLQNGNAISVRGGEYLFLFGGIEHEGLLPCTEPILYHWIHFRSPTGSFCSQQQLANLAADTRLFPEHGFLQPSQLANQLAEHICLLMKDCDGDNYAANCALTLLLDIIHTDFYRQLTQKPVSNLVLQVIQWIQTNYHQPITASSVAQQFGYHPDYLSALFRRQLDRSLSQYIIHTRLLAAQNLLSEYGLSVREVALSSGFKDEKYFIRQFTHHLGVSPGEYRKRNHLP